MIGANLGYYYSGDRCKDCAIDPNTNYSKDGLTAQKYMYMDLDGAISKEQIPDFLKKVSAINIDVINFYNSESKTKEKYQHFMLKINRTRENIILIIVGLSFLFLKICRKMHKISLTI